MKRSFLWELVLITALLFLLAGVGPQFKREALVAEAAPVTKTAPAVVAIPVAPTLALK